MSSTGQFVAQILETSAVGYAGLTASLPAFDGAPDLWQKIGADGYASSIVDAEPLASRTVQ